MRKLVSYLFISLDGVVEAPSEFMRPESYGDFSDITDQALLEQDAVLLGRQTYEDWLGFWPNSDIEPFASFINSTQKYIVSSNLSDLSWKNSTLIRQDHLAEIARLKGHPGKQIGVHGSLRLTQSLLLAGLVDELRLIQTPALAGHGRRLLEHDGPPVQLDLQSSKQSPTGLQYLVYTIRR